MPKINISMTPFVDFVVASGTPKLTAVKKAKAQYQSEYDPATDFYKPLRECIIDAAQQNLNGKETLDSVRSILVNLSARKSESYQECGEATRNGGDERMSSGMKLSLQNRPNGPRVV